MQKKKQTKKRKYKKKAHTEMDEKQTQSITNNNNFDAFCVVQLWAAAQLQLPQK